MGSRDDITKEQTMNTQDAIRKISDTARQVGRMQAEREQAFVANLTAKAALLGSVIEAVKPALPALVQRAPQAGVAKEVRSFYDWRAVRVAGVGGPVVDGRQLLLNEHATLVELHFRVSGPGLWGTRWSPLTAQHVVTEYDVAEIVDNLGAALVAQAEGTSGMKTAILLSRAKQLDAVVTLLRSMQS